MKKIIFGALGIAVIGVLIYYALSYYASSSNIIKAYNNQKTETEEQTSGTTAVPTW